MRIVAKNPIKCSWVPIWLLAVLMLFMIPMMAPLAATPPDGGEPPEAESWFEEAVKAAMAVEDEAATAEQRHQDLLEQAQEKGRIPVIVRLRMEMASEAALDAAAVQAQHDALASVQQQVLERLSATAHQDEAALGIKRFTLTPAFGIQVDALALTELLDDPNVLDVVEDRAWPPLLAQSVPLIGADSNGTFSGRTGQGWVVAILDTGVDKNHPFLSGKVVSEACYSSNTSTATSVCPGGVTQSTATNSGLNCSTSISSCAHGTHVAGIATGKGNSFSGVAKDAHLIAVQVFSRVDSASDCSPRSAPCTKAFTTDIIRGLERIYALRNSYQIASVNMSLGSGKYTSNCDSNSLKSVIDNLRAAGIATVIASGNSGYTNAISSPACISSAVSVGNTTKNDAVYSTSNSASFLDLLAPGTSIYSSVPGGGYESWNGTSMAAPHVAGAWAVLKQAKPAAGVAEVLSALKSTGKAVTDARNGITKPRIQVNTALAALIGGGGGVGTPILISPSGTISDTTPTYTWTGSSGATWYRLYVQGPSGVVIDHWYTATETNCSSDTSCAVTPTTTLASGNHRWWVQAWGSGIYSAWSSSMSFTVSGAGGLIAHYPLDGNGNDVSGNNLHAIVHGATPVAGVIGQALDFNAANGDSLEINGLNSVVRSIAFWIYFDVGNVNKYILSPQSSRGSNDGSTINWQYNDIDILLGNSGYVFNAFTSLKTGRWYHIAAVDDGTTVRTYLDGVPKKTAAGGNSLVDKDFLVMRHPTSGYGVDGKLDDLRFYSRPLTEAEVAALAHQ
ncbi:MAG: S8 family serine peptidase [Gammaproteobacteria bacterium]|nr:S8 family serine peptidase [Gammaproteobacteria bacterium]